MSFTPTEEQQNAIDLVHSVDGQNVAIEALAGAGKTATLVNLAAADTSKRYLYICFNNTVAREAEGRFGDLPVEVRTTHSLAYRRWLQEHPEFQDVFAGKRDKPWDEARRVGVHAINVSGESEYLSLKDWQVLQIVDRTVGNFCRSDKTEVDKYMVPLPRKCSRDEKLKSLWFDFTPQIASWAQTAWEMMTGPRRSLAWGENNHNIYLKLYQMSHPTIDVDVILYDEAQDANGAMLDIVTHQNAQQVFVGDRYQQINGWNGAVNAMGRVPVRHRAWMLGSFRFGPEIAEQANKVLDAMDADVMVEGLGPKAREEGPQAILTRTNNAMIGAALEALSGGEAVSMKPELKSQLNSFLNAAEKVRNGKAVNHELLQGFRNWAEVESYADESEGTDDLPLFVKLVREYGFDEIRTGVARINESKDPDVIISTVHRAKGMEWDEVTLYGSFLHTNEAGEITSPEEDFRILYVAVTRAKHNLSYEQGADHPLGLQPV